MEIFAVNLKNLPVEPELSVLMSFVSYEKIVKLKRFKNKEDCCRSLAAELMIRLVITEKTGLSNRDIHFGHNAYGKPYVFNCLLEFNLSHAGHWVVCVINNTPIGIDIEEIKPIDLGIAKRFFSYTEWMRLVNLPEKEKLGYFYNLWTLKESYVKNVGLGLSIPLHLISFMIIGEHVEFENLHTCETRYFKQYYIEDEYKLSVCAHTDNFPDKISVISFEQLALDSIRLLNK